ncbi:MAG: MFS transporter [Chloroflexota bacterium]
MTSPTVELDAAVARDFRWNLGAAVTHGVLYQTSAALTSPTSVLPAFIALLTDSTMAAGLPTAIIFVGQVLPQLMTARLIGPLAQKKRVLMGVVSLRAISWGALAWLTYRFSLEQPGWVLAALLGLLVLFSMAGGTGIVAYADVIAKVFPATRRGLFYGLRSIIGVGFTFSAGLLVRHVLARDAQFPFPGNYALLFGLAALALGIAFVGFASIREPMEQRQVVRQSWGDHLKRSLRLVRANANFRTLVWVRLLLGGSLLALPYYVLYARRVLIVPEAAVGVYVSAQVLGEAAGNFLWGAIGDRHGYGRVLRLLALVGAITPLAALAVPGGSSWVFAGVFLLLGSIFTAVEIAVNNFLLELAPGEVRPTCVALLNTLVAPLFLLPMLGGWLVGAGSFALVFTITAAVNLAGLGLSLRLKDPRLDSEAACA